MEELKKYLDKSITEMQKAYDHTSFEFSKLKAGKAFPSMLDGVRVEYYGSLVPISQIASVNNLDVRTLVIKPWDKKALKHIEEGLVKSYLDVNPQNDGEVILINIPPLTEEGRKKIAKKVKEESEKGKISIRNVRKHVKDDLEKLQKKGAAEDLIRDTKDELQKITDKHIKKIDELYDSKLKEIMSL